MKRLSPEAHNWHRRLEFLRDDAQILVQEMQDDLECVTYGELVDLLRAKGFAEDAAKAAQAALVWLDVYLDDRSAVEVAS